MGPVVIGASVETAIGEEGRDLVRKAPVGAKGVSRRQSSVRI